MFSEFGDSIDRRCPGKTVASPVRLDVGAEISL